MKAVGNHLVLTFCERTELFTIILTRNRNVFAVDVSMEHVEHLPLDVEQTIMPRNIDFR